MRYFLYLISFIFEVSSGNSNIVSIKKTGKNKAGEVVTTRYNKNRRCITTVNKKSVEIHCKCKLRKE